MADAATSCKQVFDEMPKRLNKDAASGMNAVYQFDMTGEGGGKWYASIANDQCEVKEGTHPSPNITITSSAQDYLDIVNGKLNPQMAFMTGKLRIAGDMGLALKLQSLFS